MRTTSAVFCKITRSREDLFCDRASQFRYILICRGRCFRQMPPRFSSRLSSRSSPRFLSRFSSRTGGLFSRHPIRLAIPCAWPSQSHSIQTCHSFTFHISLPHPTSGPYVHESTSFLIQPPMHRQMHSTPFFPAQPLHMCHQSPLVLSMQSLLSMFWHLPRLLSLLGHPGNVVF